MLNMITSLLQDKKGQGMVEYGLILALVAVVGMAGLILLGPQVRFELNRVKGLFPNIPVESINPQDYGLVRGENVLNHAIELAGK